MAKKKKKAVQNSGVVDPKTMTTEQLALHLNRQWVTVTQCQQQIRMAECQIQTINKEIEAREKKNSKDG